LLAIHEAVPSTRLLAVVAAVAVVVEFPLPFSRLLVVLPKEIWFWIEPSKLPRLSPCSWTFFHLGVQALRRWVQAVLLLVLLRCLWSAGRAFLQAVLLMVLLRCLWSAGRVSRDVVVVVVVV